MKSSIEAFRSVDEVGSGRGAEGRRFPSRLVQSVGRGVEVGTEEAQRETGMKS